MKADVFLFSVTIISVGPMFSVGRLTATGHNLATAMISSLEVTLVSSQLPVCVEDSFFSRHNN